MIFTSTLSDLIIAGIDIAQHVANLANLQFVFSIAFYGVLALPTTSVRKERHGVGTHRYSTERHRGPIGTVQYNTEADVY